MKNYFRDECFVDFWTEISKHPKNVSFPGNVSSSHHHQLIIIICKQNKRMSLYCPFPFFPFIHRSDSDQHRKKHKMIIKSTKSSLIKCKLSRLNQINNNNDYVAQTQFLWKFFFNWFHVRRQVKRRRSYVHVCRNDKIFTTHWAQVKFE